MIMSESNIVFQYDDAILYQSDPRIAAAKTGGPDGASQSFPGPAMPSVPVCNGESEIIFDHKYKFVIGW